MYTDNLLSKFEGKYIVFADQFPLAWKLFEDLTYIKSHFDRCNKSDFSIRPLPEITGNINSFFVNYLFFHLFPHTEKECYRNLSIFNISKMLMEKVNNDDSNEKEWQELKEWNEYLKDYWEIDLRDHIGSFIGCSGACTAVNKRWSE